MPWFVTNFPGLKQHIPKVFWDVPAGFAVPNRTVLWHAAPCPESYGMERTYAPVIKPEVEWLESLAMGNFSMDGHHPIPFQAVMDYIYIAPQEALGVTMAVGPARMIALSKLMCTPPYWVRDFIASYLRYEFILRACLIPIVLPCSPEGAGQRMTM